MPLVHKGCGDGMMMSYLRFDSARFLKNSKSWDDELKKLRDALDSITEIGGASDEPGRSSEISRPTERTSLDRMAIEGRISILEIYKAALKYCMKKLSAYDRELIEGFFYNSGSIQIFVELWCKEHDYTNRTYCYRDRRTALEHFADTAEEYMRMIGYDVPTHN